MTILQIVGALMIVAFFGGLFALVAVIEGDWRVPAVIFGAVIILGGFLLLASALLTGAVA